MAKIFEIKSDAGMDNFMSTVKLGYNELGYNEHLVMTNKYFGPICSFTTQIDPVITNPGYNECIWSVPSCSL
jgi:hypothetical protein